MSNRRKSEIRVSFNQRPLFVCWLSNSTAARELANFSRAAVQAGLTERQLAEDQFKLVLNTGGLVNGEARQRMMEGIAWHILTTATGNADRPQVKDQLDDSDFDASIETAGEPTGKCVLRVFADPWESSHRDIQ